MKDKYKKLINQAKHCTTPIRTAENALIISHIDADGLTSAAIASKALSREGIKHKIEFVKSLEPKKIKELEKQKHDLIFFTDLGSGLSPELKKIEPEIVICDHHIPQHAPIEEIWELNPHHVGIDGSTELSGASTTLTLAKALNQKNQELSDLAIVGSVGDIQDSTGKLIGPNREILKQAQKNNIIKIKKDIRLFGKQTRPIHKLLEYSSDPYIPTITGKEENCIKLIKNQGIPLKENNKWRRWIDLTQNEKKAIVSSLINKALEKGVSEKTINRLIGEVYILEKEEPGTELRDASEFSTLLNATARYNHSKTGLQLCLGKRNEVYKKAKKLLQNHRKNLVDGIKYIEQKSTKKMDNIQYIDCENKIRDTIVGIVAGMALGSNKIDRNLPIIALADKGQDKKISARTTQKMINKGINLGKAMNQASETVEGNGGGHDIAAGATIPKTKTKQFLNELNIIITNQINN
ncbi:DHH family phosphoesterase [Methanonatronarchaeum sp. AMET-Sl]|uniref:DHH family phosphoesterase n=1 Tax=Methanonatronarchaeum sp. AMET-Sl TaxID=3037654 RepID=UPI00244DCC01|nr:DHH family phosphoesterase [Methanonatronarchaeum sp. AMET-Sl]WGI17051.1 DHH family phosphoesterase [Methanonatronarchaeum sp. AMET-Sl]